MSRIQRGFASEFILSAQTKHVCCYNRCPLNCWLGKLISSKFCVPSFSYFYISCGPNGISTKQMRTTSAQTLACVSPNRQTDWASPRRNKVDLAVSPLRCGSLPGSGLLGWPVKCFAAVSVPQGKMWWHGNNRSRLIEQAYRISLWSKANGMLNWTPFFFFPVFVGGRGGCSAITLKLKLFSRYLTLVAWVKSCFNHFSSLRWCAVNEKIKMTFFNPGPQIPKPMVIEVFNHSEESKKTKVMVAENHHSANVPIMNLSKAVEHHLS